LFGRRNDLLLVRRIWVVMRSNRRWRLKVMLEKSHEHMKSTLVCTLIICDNFCKSLRSLLKHGKRLFEGEALRIDAAREGLGNRGDGFRGVKRRRGWVKKQGQRRRGGSVKEDGFVGFPDCLKSVCEKRVGRVIVAMLIRYPRRYLELLNGYTGGFYDFCSALSAFAFVCLGCRPIRRCCGVLRRGLDGIAGWGDHRRCCYVKTSTGRVRRDFFAFGNDSSKKTI
jgi:hypothetical protein